ncbi:hydantoinase B/oxoprolinase family protein [Bradyrhizobium manausense]|uniref:Hydantoinase B/oxoprolinase domain-containing protein n=1 Tax=Bradyrhizobium manausense TaxID=989370 RepID=A0A0R3DQ77_9BRAD|nr:hydantoinase B/oxoprolinase family protein [Bradyrhizobium manausense]KRQ11976.1 hypothetical protein AOQ71_17305 [Bradyrhizobium manausense]
MDLARVEIMKNRFAAMVEEAVTLAYRTAHTTLVKQTQDFGVCLARPNGERFASPMAAGAGGSGGGTIAGMTRHFEDYAPGDVVVTNDPFNTDGLVTHQMDVNLAQPIFYKGELVAFSWAFVHATDIGGAVPGSVAPDLSECFQEGFRIRPTWLIRKGVMNQDIVNIMKDNSRMGDALWGDLEAMMAAMRLMEQRVVELCDKVGADAFRQGIDDVMDYSEAKARSVIAGLNDGVYEFSDYLDGQGTDDAVHIHCKLSIEGDQARLDFAGSSPQVNAALNFPHANPIGMVCSALTNYIMTKEPSVPRNNGICRPIRASVPSGTVMNAEFPAAMGNRWMTVMRCYDALMGCLNQAVPEGIAACGAGQAGIIAASWPDPHTGRSKVAVVEPFCGGSGGRMCTDGVDGIDTMLGFLKSTPVEHVEAETPFLVRHHSLVPDSFGHGQYRGGASISIELECVTTQAAVTVRGLERFKFQPWGARGGSPGRNGETWFIKAGGSENVSLGRFGLLPMSSGDVLRMVSPSGGGFGDPLVRSPERVAHDVREQLLSESEARRSYGVVIRDGEVDAAATARVRTELKTKLADVNHGKLRLDYEARWPIEASVAFSDAILQAPPGLRTAIQREVRASFSQSSDKIDPVIVRERVAASVRRMQVSDEG